MERFLLAKYKPIPDKDPKFTAHIRAMFEDAANGTLLPDDYTPECFKLASAEQLVTQQVLKSFGRLLSLTLVDRSEEGGKRGYRYRVEYEKTTLLQHFVFDNQNKLADSQTEDVR